MPQTKKPVKEFADEKAESPVRDSGTVPEEELPDIQKDGNSAAKATVTIYNAWWTNQVDTNGNGCYKAMRLNWDADIADGSGSLSELCKVYYKQDGTSAWTLFHTTPVYTITDTSTADTRYVDVAPGTGCSLWDYKIEVYRSGQASPDHTRSDSNDTDLNNHKEETPEQDQPTPSAVYGDLSTCAGDGVSVACNGAPGGLDASLILRWYAGLTNCLQSCPDNIAYTRPAFPPTANVNGDSVLGGLDASLVLQYYAGLITCFPADPNCPSKAVDGAAHIRHDSGEPRMLVLVASKYLPKKRVTDWSCLLH